MPDPDRPARFNPTGDLLDLAEARPGDRLLLVHGGPELLCSALRHGCRSAVSLAAPPRHPEPADLVIAEGVASQAEAVAVAESARRALGRGGRLALTLRGAAAQAARRLVRSLHEYGFSRVRRRAGLDGVVLLLCRQGADRGAVR
ncbi:hypothetical protein EJV46_15205 [Roseococcus sp. SYP-B2431]|uniref:hypothetical protein n=1 Tax=Roseococcus sp. SYP-B2431 TaxID=2496640 RepID=UPI00103BB6F1|nr:hypothetical protein [Roseococcus sp. SYP-B2431]TCH97473.1 hypothetical protein EJV46_15205 [Roseococcus sp. SYP-B2431]